LKTDEPIFGSGILNAPKHSSDLKRGYARMLRILLEEKGGGGSTPAYAALKMQKDYNKPCLDDAAFQIFCLLSLWGFAVPNDEETVWNITPSGEKFLSLAMVNRPDLLKETTSPGVRCFA
jgi:hypothetical protein